jgi:hypothetical protein
VLHSSLKLPLLHAASFQRLPENHARGLENVCDFSERCAAALGPRGEAARKGRSPGATKCTGDEREQKTCCPQ